MILEKLRRIGVSESEIGDDFDLVGSGLLNSLEFVEIVALLEKEFHCEIDYEAAFEKGELTTPGGLIRTFENHMHG
ncbi:MAG: acyl carrier protein [Bacteroidales bacterium]|nr:acyl carrier protein [Bacteroidales bacterium]